MAKLSKRPSYTLIAILVCLCKAGSCQLQLMNAFKH